MSDTLTSQDLKNSQEMSDALEMGELRKITTLQDISLVEGKDTFQQTHEENERKLKTNSLKRFFRLTHKKKSDDGCLEAGKTELEIEEALGRKALSGSFSKASLKSSLSGYWSSVFKSKKSEKSTKSTQDIDANACEVTSSGMNAAAKDPQDNVCIPKDSNVAEDIQSLSISEECPPK